MFLCAIGLVSGLISACAAPEPLATGYVEGDYVRVAPVAVAQVESLAVARGSRFVRVVFLVVVSGLIARLVADIT